MRNVAFSCPACGAMADPQDRYCEACGDTLGPPAGAVPAADQPGDHVEADLGRAAGVSDRGVHHQCNEDALRLEYSVDAIVAVVCDGVSTSATPELASRRAVEAATRVLVAEIRGGRENSAAVTTHAVQAATEAVRALPWLRGTGTSPPSCTLLSAICCRGAVTIGAVGDSRAYWFGDHTARTLTKDDSWAQEQIAADVMTADQALSDPRAHSITRWLGRDAPPGSPEIISWRPDVPGRLILCSDGLWNYAASAQELGRFVRAQANAAPLQLARRLTEHALESGGHDNITVVVIDVVS
jgi:PPM family protein phosphatase